MQIEVRDFFGTQKTHSAAFLYYPSILVNPRFDIDAPRLLQIADAVETRIVNRPGQP